MRNFSSGIPLDALNSIQAGSLRYTYRGIPMVKNPFDIALYTKLLFDLKPRTVIEIGTYRGGSALWFADMLTSYAIDARILSVDISPPPSLEDDRLTFIRGDALKLEAALPPEILSDVRRPLLVIDDGAHTYDSCLAALRFFHPFLLPREYVVVEDGIVADLPPHPDIQYGRGPQWGDQRLYCRNKWAIHN